MELLHSEPVSRPLAGYFGSRSSNLEIYSDRLILKSKKESITIPNEQITAIQLMRPVYSRFKFGYEFWLSFENEEGEESTEWLSARGSANPFANSQRTRLLFMALASRDFRPINDGGLAEKLRVHAQVNWRVLSWGSLPESRWDS